MFASRCENPAPGTLGLLHLGLDKSLLMRRAEREANPGLPFDTAVLLEDLFPHERLTQCLNRAEHVILFLPAIYEDTDDVASASREQHLPNKAKPLECLSKFWPSLALTREDHKGLLDGERQ